MSACKPPSAQYLGAPGVSCAHASRQMGCPETKVMDCFTPRLPSTVLLCHTSSSFPDLRLLFQVTLTSQNAKEPAGSVIHRPRGSSEASYVGLLQPFQKGSTVLQDRAMHIHFLKSLPREGSWHGIQITFSVGLQCA